MMSVTITLKDGLAQRLQAEASSFNTTLESFANQLLERVLPPTAATSDTDAQLVALVNRIRATPPNLAMIRHAQPGLPTLLLHPGEQELSFDEPDWNRQWAAIESEMDEIERLDELADQAR